MVEQKEPKPKQVVTETKRSIKEPEKKEKEEEETTSFGAALRNVLDFRSEEE